MLSVLLVTSGLTAQLSTDILLDDCMKSLQEMQEKRDVYINWEWIGDMDDISTGPTYRFGPIAGQVYRDKSDEMFMRCMEQHEILHAQVVPN
jgi:hypothetical protein